MINAGNIIYDITIHVSALNLNQIYIIEFISKADTGFNCSRNQIRVYYKYIIIML
jgi:plastocyanin domain-containing protein